jgi:hypothetical protein
MQWSLMALKGEKEETEKLVMVDKNIPTRI